MWPGGGLPRNRIRATEEERERTKWKEKQDRDQRGQIGQKWFPCQPWTTVKPDSDRLTNSLAQNLATILSLSLSNPSTAAPSWRSGCLISSKLSHGLWTISIIIYSDLYIIYHDLSCCTIWNLHKHLLIILVLFIKVLGRSVKIKRPWT